MPNMGSLAINGGDIAVKNYGGTDIGAGLVVLADTANVTSPSTAPGVLLPTNGGGVLLTMGITVEAIPAGKVGRMRLLGAYPVKANGTVTYGDKVQASDTVAKLGWVKTCGAATQQVGIALGTATDGVEVLVWVAPAQNA